MKLQTSRLRVHFTVFYILFPYICTIFIIGFAISKYNWITVNNLCNHWRIINGVIIHSWVIVYDIVGLGYVIVCTRVSSCSTTND